MNNNRLIDISESRNKALANCFYRLPQIEVSDHAFVVSLPNMNYKKQEKTNKDMVLDI